MSTALALESEFRDLFLREARVASRIEHANVVRVYDSGELDGDLFLAMELVEGVSLARLQQTRNQLAIGVVLRILLDLLRGLHFAHEQRDPEGTALGLVHQDVSPHNVLVAYDGCTKLLDFGVARLAQRGSRTDNVRGKPGYLAPEQIALGRLDRRVDVFAVGVLAHELLTGERLFAAETIPAIHARVLSAAIPRVDDVCSAVPSGIADVVERALRRTPDERWPTADALRRALRDAATNAGIVVADDEAVAECVRAIAPPTWSREAIERALSAAERSADVADLPTLAPRNRARDEATEDVGAIVDPKLRKPSEGSPRARRAAWGAGITIAIVFAIFATRALRRGSAEAPPPLSPAPSAPAATAIVAPAITSTAPSVSSTTAATPSAIPSETPSAAPRAKPPRVQASAAAVSATPALPSAPAVVDAGDDPFGRQ